LIAKKACGGTAFIWLFASFSSIVYAPLALYILAVDRPELAWPHFALIAASAVLHSLYFLLLDKGYRIGDLSVIYPLARGTGPLLSTLTAIAFLGERPSAIALAGAALIAIGIVFITGNPLSLANPAARKPVFFAILCGMTIASYTIVDKISVSALLIPPLLLDWTTNLGRVLLLTPYALRNWDKVRLQFRDNRRAAFGVAVLSPLSYILVLTAMVFSPVSYIAPAREVSILIGAVLGAKLLAEGNSRARISGACAMLFGLVALSAG
jgi:uncharacterized membrane protein